MSAPAVVREVVLVGCSGPKLEHEALARDLYTSPLFKAARAYAEATYHPWAILSARHGLVFPDQLVEPYDATFKSLGYRKRDMEAWGSRVGASVREAWPGLARIVFLAGSDYAYCLQAFPHDARPAITEPLKGMGIGLRISWLQGETKAMSSPAAPTRPCGGCAMGASANVLHTCGEKGWNVCPFCDELVDVPSDSHDGTEAKHCGRPLVVVELEDGSFSLDAGDASTEHNDCDFCARPAFVAVSEHGAQRFEDVRPARICGPCAAWALEALRADPVTS